MSLDHIAIVGTYDPGFEPHVKLRNSIVGALAQVGSVINTRWISPEEIEEPTTILEDARAAVIAPVHPRQSGALIPEYITAITWLRENRVPTLGIEGGFDHMIIEMARNVLGHQDATSSTFDDNAQNPVVVRFDRRDPVVGRTIPKLVDIELNPGTQLADAYGQTGIVREAFSSPTVFNADYMNEAEGSGFCLSARGAIGPHKFIAAAEWNAMPFFIGVSFMPQLSPTRGGHPILKFLLNSIDSQQY